LLGLVQWPRAGSLRGPGSEVAVAHGLVGGGGEQAGEQLGGGYERCRQDKCRQASVAVRLAALAFRLECGR